MTGDWRKQYPDELSTYQYDDQIEEDEIDWACGTFGDGGEEICIRDFEGKPEGKRAL